ncbi:MAG: cupredoxin family copper-binding protein [Gammaproteobacteria bacterium]
MKQTQSLKNLLAARTGIFLMLLAGGSCLAAESTQAAHEPRKITIGNFTFSPATLEVPVGTTLLWVNEDDVPHVVIGSDPGSPVKSPALDTDGQYSLLMDHPGTYRYFCSLHPHMTGTIIVK